MTTLEHLSEHPQRQPRHPGPAALERDVDGRAGQDPLDERRQTAPVPADDPVALDECGKRRAGVPALQVEGGFGGPRVEDRAIAVAHGPV
jgi:hypothetical protein